MLQVEGTIEKGHVTLDFPKIDGKWDEGLTATYKGGTKQLIWKVNPPARDPTRCILELCIGNVIGAWDFVRAIW